MGLHPLEVDLHAVAEPPEQQVLDQRVRRPVEVLRTVTEEELSDVTDALIEAADAGAWARARTEDPWYAARLTSADGAARAVGARAFTTGRNVVFAAGQYAPSTENVFGVTSA